MCICVCVCEVERKEVDVCLACVTLSNEVKSKCVQVT